MHPKRLFALAVIIIFAAAPLSPSLAAAPSSPYSEKLSIYTAGSSAFWSVTLNGVNASSAIAQVEASMDVGGYSLTAVKTVSWVSDFQVFGPTGYNLLKLPFIPDQGLFLTVSNSSYPAASAIALAFDQYLGAAFTSLSNETGTFTYFSPVSFSTVIPKTLLSPLPSNSSGFAALVKASSFAGLSSPFVTLTSQKTASGFTHSLIFGSIKSGAVDQSGNLQLLNLFGTSPSFIEAAKFSDSSTIIVHALDGLISSSDKATVLSNRANFSGSYSYTVPQNVKINKLNLTILELPAIAVGTRILDRGALNPGDSVSVTLNVKNIANMTIQNFTVSDDWWRSLPGIFQLTNGQSDFNISSIAPGSSASRIYVLKVNSSGNGQVLPSPRNILIPAVVGHFSYSFGGRTFTGSTGFNPLQILIGQVGPSVSITTSPDSTTGKPIGTVENLVVTVTNFGNGPALNLRVGNYTTPSLAQGGQTWVVKVPVQVTSLTHPNVTRGYVVTWQTSGGLVQNITSNLSNLVFSHKAMLLGYGRTTVNGTLTYLSPSTANLTLNYATLNVGRTSMQSFTGEQTLPSWLGCGKVAGANVSCSNGVLRFNYAFVKQGIPIRANVSYVLKQARNFVIPPATFNYTSNSISFVGSSGAFAVPAGIIVQKTLNPSPVIQGMQSRVALSASNQGPFSLYNLTLSTSPDSFDALLLAQPPAQKYYPVIGTRNSVSFNFSVIISGQTGNRSLAPGLVQFLFAGTKFALLVPQGTALIYPPLRVTMTTSPSSPLEGNSFNVIVSVSNPAGVDVTNVQLSLPLPVGVQVVRAVNVSAGNGVLTASIDRLPAMGVYKANVTLKSSAGLSFGLSGGSITFSYAGAQVKGSLALQAVTVNEDVLSRYTLPLLVAILAVLATTLIVRRGVSSTSPSSPQQTPQKQP